LASSRLGGRGAIAPLAPPVDPPLSSSFHYGTVKPILKNKHGDQTRLDMYRGITLTSVISKLFEAVIYKNSFCGDLLRFGFKQNSGFSHTLYGFTEAVKARE